MERMWHRRNLVGVTTDWIRGWKEKKSPRLSGSIWSADVSNCWVVTNSPNIRGFMWPSIRNLVSLWVKWRPPAVSGARLHGALHVICEAAGATLACVSYSPCPSALVWYCDPSDVYIWSSFPFLAQSSYSPWNVLCDEGDKGVFCHVDEMARMGAGCHEQNVITRLEFFVPLPDLQVKERGWGQWLNQPCLCHKEEREWSCSVVSDSLRHHGL